MPTQYERFLELRRKAKLLLHRDKIRRAISIEDEVLAKPLNIFKYVKSLNSSNSVQPTTLGSIVVMDTEDFCEEFVKYFQSVYHPFSSAVGNNDVLHNTMYW